MQQHYKHSFTLDKGIRTTKQINFFYELYAKMPKTYVFCVSSSISMNFMIFMSNVNPEHAKKPFSVIFPGSNPLTYACG